MTVLDPVSRSATMLLDHIPAIGLAELDDRAALRVRTDRKYLVDVDVLERVLRRAR